MGIKNLGAFLREKCPGAIGVISIKHFKGMKIAIDTFGWMYTNMAVVQKKVINSTNILVEEPDRREILKNWLSAALEFAALLTSNEITPVFVFDGEAPIEKAETKESRKNDKKALLDKIAGLKSGTTEKDPLLINEGTVAELKKLMSQVINIGSREIEAFKTVMDSVGIPIVQAKHEGEQLCSMLCREGKVSAVFSADTDNLVYGCPVLLNGFADEYSYSSTGERVRQFNCISHKMVLDMLSLNSSEFVDLCIMAGCDYNTNIYRIGAVTAYKMIQTHGNIDNIVSMSKYVESGKCLKHERCRELFTPVPSDTLMISGKLDIDTKRLTNAREILESYGLRSEERRVGKECRS